MLNLYAWDRCPHCHAAIAWLNEHKIPFEYHEIEEQPPEILQRVVEVNGGDDWVVPTLEFHGKWVPGRAFDPVNFKVSLRELGVI